MNFQPKNYFSTFKHKLFKTQPKRSHVLVVLKRNPLWDVLYCIKLLPLYPNFASLPDFKEICLAWTPWPCQVVHCLCHFVNAQFQGPFNQILLSIIQHLINSLSLFLSFSFYYINQCIHSLFYLAFYHNKIFDQILSIILLKS